MKKTDGQRFFELRKRFGYTREELAEKLGVHLKTIYCWEKDHYPVPKMAWLAMNTLLNSH